MESHIPVKADVETQTEVEMDRGEEGSKRTRNISEILMEISLAYEHMQDLKEQYRDALPELKKFGDMEMEKFLRTYAKLKVRVMDEYDEYQMIKLFKCNFCSYSSERKRNVACHMEKNHTLPNTKHIKKETSITPK